MGNDAWRGFVQGVNIKLEINDNLIQSGRALVFASVIAHFLKVVTSVNSFINLEVFKHNEDRRWHKWRLIPGLQDLL